MLVSNRYIAGGVHKGRENLIAYLEFTCLKATINNINDHLSLLQSILNSIFIMLGLFFGILFIKMKILRWQIFF